MKELYTIGHSTHPLEGFLELLGMQGVTAVADVRSVPYSRFNPQYNRETLKNSLEDAGIAYVWLGMELGPRGHEPNCYVEGKSPYPCIAQTELFREGLERLRRGMEKHRVAMMCAEKDPVTCHRMILICRALRRETMKIWHIREDGSLESLAESEKRLARTLKLERLELFETEDDFVERAYDMQGQRLTSAGKKKAGVPFQSKPAKGENQSR
ncbi:MAG: DUF488 family protein [Thermovirgaceae bacterium]